MVIIQQQEKHLSRIMRIFLIILGLISLSWKNSHSADIIIRPESLPRDIGPDMERLKDSAGISLVEEAAALDQGWQSESEVHLNNGISSETIWYRFKAQNQSGEDIFLSLNYPQIHTVSLYYQASDGSWQESTSGVSMPFSSRELSSRYHNFRLQPGSAPVTYYLKIKPLHSLTTRPRLLTQAQLVEIESRDSMPYWMYLGFILFAVLFNLAFFFTTRQSNFLFLALYILCWLGFHYSLGGVGFRYLWPQSLWWEQKSFLIFTPLVGLFVIFFFRNFLETWTYPWIDRFYLWVMLPSIILDIGLALWAPSTLAMSYTVVRGGLFTIINLSAAAIICFYYKNPSALYLFLGFLGMPFSTIFMGLEGAGVFHVGLSAAVTNIIANIWLVMWFTLAVSRKFFQVEKRARLSELRYGMLKETMMDGYLLYDQRGIILDTHPAFCRVLGYTPSELVGRPVQDLIASQSLSWEQLLGHMKKHEVSDVFEKEYINRSGNKVPVEYRVYRQSVELPRESHFMEVIRDISRRRESERRLRHIQKLDAVGRLAGGIAHDFNNMLTGILGSADILEYRLNQKDTSQLSQYVGMIKETAQRAARLTGQLLDFSRKSELSREIIDLNQLLKDVVQLLERTVNTKIRIELEAEPDLTVSGDVDSIHNGLLNLGINARDAISESGTISYQARCVKITEAQRLEWGLTLPQEDFVCIRITDNGCGIPPEHLEQIFDPYFTTKKQGRGTGLGLAAVYGMIREHLGHISVSSEPGLGTTFELFLPQSREVPAKTAPDSLDTILTGQARILAAEDEPAIQSVLKEMLSTLGYQVSIAQDGEQALRMLSEEEYDLAILDVSMPGKTGVEVFYELLRLQPGLPVILASGYEGIPDLMRLRDQGLKTYIRKPITLQALSRAIYQALQGQDDSVKPHS